MENFIVGLFKFVVKAVLLLILLSIYIWLFVKALETYHTILGWILLHIFGVSASNRD